MHRDGADHVIQAEGEQNAGAESRQRAGHQAGDDGKAGCHDGTASGHRHQPRQAAIHGFCQ